MKWLNSLAGCGGMSPRRSGPIPMRWPALSALMRVEDQFRRAAMGRERQQVQLAAFEALLAKAIGGAVVRHCEEAAAHGVDVWHG